ncbi:hypothetical protein CN120_20330 [Sinorhizobium meliloti]|uniref:hypothetical protein n=1 Tax=Rhizobium meliloti TaxID=382 RepID=UPI000FDBE1B3|nr:hypothetical protein [Sinorhizobium meliloti]MDE3812297.1 hypothetical protein [Sinorhizobium meliloti]RVN01762.1 hypothetical protein CN120_20330 [Sinorhizobium meliloti]
MTSHKSFSDIRWYHGSKARFDRWSFPPPPQPSSRLGSHSGVFFASSRTYAKNCGPIVYQTKLDPGANVLDLRQPSTHVDAFRHLLIASNERAKMLFSLETGAHWQSLMDSGYIFQPPLYSEEQRTLLEGHNRWLKRKTPADEEAFWAVRRIQREWIEAFAQTARDLGWQAFISREGTRLIKGLKVSDILCVLTDGVIAANTVRVRL